MKKLVTLLLAMVMIFSLATTAFAQTVGTEAAGTGSITISNASKGETYAIYKLFDATVDGEGAIAYTGTIPEALSAYFTKDSAGNIALAEDVEEAELFAALKTWAESADATATAESDGSELKFVGLAYGYYVVTTTQGDAAISVTSTNPNATIVDKNTTPPIKEPAKVADGEDYNIGDTITYTVSFKTANYDGEKQIVSYTIKDTLPEFLSNVTVTKITVDGQDIAVQQFADKKITIAWVDDAGNNLYANGAKIEITYTAVLTDEADIDGEGNTNTVTISYKTDDDGGNQTTVNDTIYTYAIALKKVNQKGEPLANATFQFPFYVKETADTDGAYIYAGKEAGEGLVNQLTTPADGLIIVKGVKAGSYEITETVAPNGYNKLTAPVTVTATKTGATTTTTTTYLDKDGNVVDTQTEGGSTVLVDIKDLAATPIVVVNKAGTELPSTGGMGTTLFYAIGGMMMLAAVVLLVTKKRMASAE